MGAPLRRQVVLSRPGRKTARGPKKARTLYRATVLWNEIIAPAPDPSRTGRLPISTSAGRGSPVRRARPKIPYRRRLSVRGHGHVFLRAGATDMAKEDKA